MVVFRSFFDSCCQVISCLSFISVAVIKPPPPKATQGEEGLFGLQFLVPVHNCRKPLQWELGICSHTPHLQSKAEGNECTHVSCLLAQPAFFPLKQSRAQHREWCCPQRAGSITKTILCRSIHRPIQSKFLKCSQVVIGYVMLMVRY